MIAELYEKRYQISLLQDEINLILIKLPYVHIGNDNDLTHFIMGNKIHNLYIHEVSTGEYRAYGNLTELSKYFGQNKIKFH